MDAMTGRDAPTIVLPSFLVDPDRERPEVVAAGRAETHGGSRRPRRGPVMALSADDELRGS